MCPYIIFILKYVKDQKRYQDATDSSKQLPY